MNAAALGEHRSGAARGVSDLLYITVGTGIGGGAIVRGNPVHGRIHPEFGHIRIPHDWIEDPFAGTCPFHGDCLEGLASGEAMRARAGVGGEHITEERTWEREAAYLAVAVVNALLTLSPERVVLRGGVMKRPGLLERVRLDIERLVGGYLDSDSRPFRAADVIVAAGLGDRSGVVGALELARDMTTSATTNEVNRSACMPSNQAQRSLSSLARTSRVLIAQRRGPRRPV